MGIKVWCTVSDCLFISRDGFCQAKEVTMFSNKWGGEEVVICGAYIRNTREMRKLKREDNGNQNQVKVRCLKTDCAYCSNTDCLRDGLNLFMGGSRGCSGLSCGYITREEKLLRDSHETESQRLRGVNLGWNQ